MNSWKRIGLVCLGIGIMWLESRFTATPGLGFGLALGCIMWAAVG